MVAHGSPYFIKAHFAFLLLEELRMHVHYPTDGEPSSGWVQIECARSRAQKQVNEALSLVHDHYERSPCLA